MDGHLVLSDPVRQIDIHRKFGGVVPELASRNHVVEVIPVIEEALEAASMSWEFRCHRRDSGARIGGGTLGRAPSR